MFGWKWYYYHKHGSCYLFCSINILWFISRLDCQMFCLFKSWWCLHISRGFKNSRFKITILMETGQAPHFIKIHCMAPRMNLVVYSLFPMLMVSYLLQLFYGYFSNSPKHHLEFQTCWNYWNKRFKSWCEDKVDQHVGTFEVGWEKIQDANY